LVMLGAIRTVEKDMRRLAAEAPAEA
jgi:hypothetical protein